MVLFKEKKSRNKTSQSDLRITLDAEHTNKIKNFNDNKKNIYKKYKKLEQLKNEYETLSIKNSYNLSDIEIENKLLLKEEIESLSKEINTIEKFTNVNKYLINTSHMLYQYYNDDRSNKKHKNKNNNECLNKNKSVVDFFTYKLINNENKINDTNSNKSIQSDEILDNSIDKKNNNKEYSKMEIIEKYFNYIDDKYIPDSNLEIINIDYCIDCYSERIFYQSEGIMICPNCATQEKILIDSDKPSYKEPPREISYFAYKRINHFNEWLAQFQAKESTDISKDIYKLIKNELLKESYVDMKNLKISKVRDILKKLNLNKYYEHVPHIINRLSGRPAPIIDRDVEEKLRMMFKEIQNPWMSHCPNKRSNFLSYSYVLYKCLQLLEMDEFLKHFSLLKSREKLAEQDIIWKKICEELKWQYIKTI